MEFRLAFCSVPTMALLRHVLQFFSCAIQFACLMVSTENTPPYVAYILNTHECFSTFFIKRNRQKNALSARQKPYERAKEMIAKLIFFFI